MYTEESFSPLQSPGTLSLLALLTTTTSFDYCLITDQEAEKKKKQSWDYFQHSRAIPENRLFCSSFSTGTVNTVAARWHYLSSNINWNTKPFYVFRTIVDLILKSHGTPVRIFATFFKLLAAANGDTTSSRLFVVDDIWIHFSCFHNIRGYRSSKVQKRKETLQRTRENMTKKSAFQILFSSRWKKVSPIMRKVNISS